MSENKAHQPFSGWTTVWWLPKRRTQSSTWICGCRDAWPTQQLPSSKSTFSQPSKEKCISEVMRIGSMILFHLSKLWKAKFSLLCDVIFLVRPQGKFDIDQRAQSGVCLLKCAWPAARKYACLTLQDLAKKRWNFISTSIELHGHGDERWPTEVTSNTHFRGVRVTAHIRFTSVVPCFPWCSSLVLQLPLFWRTRLFSWDETTGRSHGRSESKSGLQGRVFQSPIRLIQD